MNSHFVLLDVIYKACHSRDIPSAFERLCRQLEMVSKHRDRRIPDKSNSRVSLVTYVLC